MAEAKCGGVFNLRDIEFRQDPPKHEVTRGWPLVNPKTCPGAQLEFHITEIQPEGAALDDVHEKEDHVFYVLSGRAKAKVGDDDFDVEPGDALYVPEEHGAQLPHPGRRGLPHRGRLRAGARHLGLRAEVRTRGPAVAPAPASGARRCAALGRARLARLRRPGAAPLGMFPRASTPGHRGTSSVWTRLGWARQASSGAVARGGEVSRGRRVMVVR